ncbi:hypothetical protein SAMN05216327_101202 [Dyadobacter sp. SG02]|uniref:hypothetical protein n=1 Tax=Dyadobacter sp. SG02 TaxID=1855291 RepID=UPI0008CE43EE|nr:hypothetical protein [Dyadobacter sp. SG02]SEI39498.1 hypothetical protein SAMN05216327_101202 [Dyadobacter sp. SG02]
MINFGSFPFTDSQKELINESIKNYWRFARVEVKGEPGFDGNGQYALLVDVTQKELVNEKILTADELVDRGTKIFAGATPEGQLVRIYANPFK